MKSVLSNLLMVAAGVVLSAILIEGVCRVLYTQKLDYQIEMSRYAANLKRTSQFYDVGHEHRPASRATLMGVEVSINSHGFRDVEYPIEKPAGVYRVMLLGDSVTFGWGAASEDLFATHLQNRLTERFAASGRGLRVQVMNTGVGNYNTDQQVAFFEARGNAFRPDLVILAYFINDAEPTPRQKSPLIIKYSYLAMSLWGRLDTFNRIYLKRADYSDYYPGLYAEDQPGWKQSRAAFGRLARMAEEQGFSLVMAILPELHAVGRKYGFEEIHTTVRAAANAAGIRHVIDLAPEFAEEEPDTLWVSLNDAHPNARAHAIIARGIDAGLEEIGL